MDSGGEAFSSIDIVTQCLLDSPRVTRFRRAIQKQVRPGDHVLDVGTGSGIMALLAVRAGAEKVSAIEFDPHVAETAERIIRANDLQDIISLLRVDARTHRFSKKQRPFDVVIMEMLTTGMIDEFQVQATNNLLRQKLITAHTRLVPERQDTFVTAGFYNFKKYGFVFPAIYHTWQFMSKEARAFRAHTKRARLSSISFKIHTKEKFSKRVRIAVTKTGTINCLRLESETKLAPGVTVADTDSLNGPVIVPVTPRACRRGTNEQFDIRYTFGGGYQTFVVR